MLAIYAPLNGFLILLADGWRFPGMVVEPMRGSHGDFATLMVRSDG